MAALLAIELRPPVALLIAKASSDLVCSVFGSKVESNRVSYNGNVIVKWMLDAGCSINMRALLKFHNMT